MSYRIRKKGHLNAENISRRTSTCVRPFLLTSNHNSHISWTGWAKLMCIWAGDFERCMITGGWQDVLKDFMSNFIFLHAAEENTGTALLNSKELHGKWHVPLAFFSRWINQLLICNCHLSNQISILCGNTYRKAVRAEVGRNVKIK